METAAEQIEIRPAGIERDAELIKRLDTSFKTDTIFEVHSDDRSFQLIECPVNPPVSKTFLLDDLDAAAREWESVWIALDGDRPVGLVATEHDDWNQRVIIWHVYVDPPHRRQGLGRRLLDTALEAARVKGARGAWLETSNLNVPGVRAYERLGFRLCGLDTNLYDGTPAEGEIALFLCRSLTS